MERDKIIIRLRGESGQYRVTVSLNDTFKTFVEEIAKTMQSDPSTVALYQNDKRVNAKLNTKLGSMRGVKHGAIFVVKAVLVEKKAGTGISESEIMGDSKEIKIGEDAAKKVDAAHIPFDEYLDRKNALKPRNKKQRKIVAVDLPFEESYVIKKSTQYDKVIPSLNINRQKYRHVDYVMFQNFKEISGFVQYWMTAFENRVGFLYGYYAEDPDYIMGIRSVVEAIYEPPQKGDYNDALLMKDYHSTQVDMVASGLSLEKVGWIYTSTNSDVIMAPDKMIQAAKYQMEHIVNHPCGYKVPKFVTVVLRKDKETGNVLPEVYMMSDYLMAMIRDNLLDPVQDLPDKIKIKADDDLQLIPNVLVESKTTKEVPVEFFLIKVNSGQPRHSKFAYLKTYDFPIENRNQPVTRKDLKKYLQRYRNHTSYQRFANFHLLLYISKEMDIDSAMQIGDKVKDGEGPGETMMEIINTIADS